MRKIGGHVSTAGGVLNAIKNTEEIGGNCMQIFAGSPRMWRRSLYDEGVAQEFKETVKKNNLTPVFIHALYLTNLASDKDELRQKSKEAIIMDMKNSALLGSDGVILHIGSHQGRGFEGAIQTIVSEIKEILSETPEDSTLILENSAGQKGKVGSLEEIGQLLDDLNDKRVKVCLDTAHAFESGHALNNPQGLDMFAKSVEKNIGVENIVVLHLNDSRTKLGSGHDQHENIGEGFIGKKGLSDTINHKLFKHLPLILEVPGFEKQGPDARNVEIVKSLVE